MVSLWRYVSGGARSVQSSSSASDQDAARCPLSEGLLGVLGDRLLSWRARKNKRRRKRRGKEECANLVWGNKVWGGNRVCVTIRRTLKYHTYHEFFTEFSAR